MYIACVVFVIDTTAHINANDTAAVMIDAYTSAPQLTPGQYTVALNALPRSPGISTEKSTARNSHTSVRRYEAASTNAIEIIDTTSVNSIFVTSTFGFESVVSDIDLIIDVFLSSNNAGPNTKNTAVVIDNVTEEEMISPAGRIFPSPIRITIGNMNMNNDDQFLKNCFDMFMKYPNIIYSPPLEP